MARLTETEEQLHLNCVRWFKYKYGKVLMCHIPNESKSKPQYRMKLKNLGLKKGMPDIMVFSRSFNAPYHTGLAIELKSKTGRTSPEQKEVIEELTKQGWKCHIINNIDDFIRVVLEYFSDG